MKQLTFILIFCLTRMLLASENQSTVSTKQSQVDEIATSINNWVEGAVYAKAYLFDYSVNQFEPLLNKGKLHPGVYKNFTKRLTQKQYAQLKSAITGKHQKHGGLLCHWPHHGFVFFDEFNKPIGSIDVCFLCSSTRKVPRHGLSTYSDLDSLRELAIELGMPNFKTPQEWENFFKKLKKPSK